MGRAGLCRAHDLIHRIKLFLRTGYRGKCRQSEKGKAKSCVCSYGKYSHTWIFKYYGFLLDTVNSFLTTDIPYRVLPLPIGISFYTFQAISYVIDIYRKDAKPQKNILYFALYISMFPQLIAGPIVRYADIEEQLKMRKVTLRKLGQGSMYFIIGLAKK